MNILFINDFPFPNAGGVGRVTETIAAEFVNIGHKVFYFALRKGTPFESNGIMQYFAPSKTIFSKENISCLENFLQKNAIDIIINQGGPKPEVLKTIIKANKRKVKLISVHHGCVIGSQENYHNIIKENFRDSKLKTFVSNPFSLFLLKRLSRYKLNKNYYKAIVKSEKFVLLSEAYKEELRYFVKTYPPEKVISIPNPLPFDLKSIESGKKENRLLFVGRINYSEKQAHLLIELWRRIYPEFPVWSLDIVGDGPKLQDLKNKAKALNLPNITFHGYTDPRPHLEKAKIFCLTSAFEGFGLVLVEAQAYGVVPLAFNVTSGIRDIINDGKNGILVKPFDLDAYEATLRNLMKNENRLKLLAVDSIINAARFDKSIIIKQWMNQINRVL